MEISVHQIPSIHKTKKNPNSLVYWSLVSSGLVRQVAQQVEKIREQKM